MTVSTITNRVSYSGDDVTVAFPYTFPATATSELQVILRSSSGAETTKTLTTDYTATAGDSGGTVTCTSFTPATGETLLIKRIMPLTQALDLVTNDSMDAENIEDSLDKLTMIAQQLNEVTGRQIVLQETSSLSGVNIDDPVADYYLKVNSDGDGIEMVATIDATITGVTTYMETLLDDTDAATARATLGVPTISEVAADLDTYQGPLTDSGAADAYEITSGRSLTAYAAGQTFFFVVGNTNTGGAVTLDVDSIGATSVVRAEDGENPFIGQMTAGAVVGVKYDEDNTRFDLIFSDTRGVHIDTATATATGTGNPSASAIDLSSDVPAGATYATIRVRAPTALDALYGAQFKAEGDTNYTRILTTYGAVAPQWTIEVPLSSDRKIRATWTHTGNWSLWVVDYR